MKVSAILLMSGEGKRFSSSLPKQFHRLSGKKIYLYTFETFLKSSLFAEIILVCSEDRKNDIIQDLAAYNNQISSQISIKIISGGPTRQSSSFLGIQAARHDFVVIHDAVRPFVTHKILRDNINGLKNYDACNTCLASTDTIVYSTNQKQIDSIPTRSHFLRGQTPQSFRKDLIQKAHKHALNQKIYDASDDCQLVLMLNKPIHIISGDECNIKITSSLDLYLAERLLHLQTSSLSLSATQSLKGKIFIVTGSTGGIGLEICNLLKQEKAKVLSLSLSSKEYPIDLTNYKKSTLLFRSLKKKFGDVDGLINSIGFLKVQSFDQLSFKDLSSLIKRNFTAVAYCSKLCALKENAHIINIASSSYSRGRKNYAVYSAMKAAVVNFTQGLSLERPSLSINSIIPKRTKTKMRLENFPQEDPSTLFHPQDVAKKVIETLKTPKITGLTIEF